MSTQPEQILEDKLVAQLQQFGYAFVLIRDEKELLANLKAQLENHNSVEFFV
jgi:type I restriction enzyme, R subunit